MASNPFLYTGVAQLVEHWSPKPVVGRSSRSAPAKLKRMKKFLLYIKDVYRELAQKVTWPAWQELQSSAVVVMVASIIIALVVFLLDLTFKGAMKFVYGLFY